MKRKNPPLASVKTEPEDIKLKEVVTLILQKYALEKIICFGSNKTISEFKNLFVSEVTNSTKPLSFNNYCLMLIPSKDEKCADKLIQQRIEEELKSVANLVIIVHRMEEINTALQRGSSFFIALYEKGQLIHDHQQELFVSPGEGKPISKRILAKEEFWQHWSELSANFLKGAQFYSDHNIKGLSVFMLHQALQHCYSGMLRVLIGYRSNSNGLARLIKLINQTLPNWAFNPSTQLTSKEARLVGLLLKGFGDARYNDSFNITDQELVELKDRIENILKEADITCKLKIQNLKDGIMQYVA